MQAKNHVITSKARFDWLAFLSDPANKNASCVHVNCLPFSPLADIWKELVTLGLKVEVKNNDCNTHHGYWIASVVKIAGYYICLRYEGFGNDSSRDFWMAISDPEIHPVGWCAARRNTLVPPATVEKRYNDWRGFLQNQLTGSCTLPDTFYEQLKESLSSRLKVGMRLEVVDKKRISAVRLAHIEDIIGGRLHVRYTAENDPNDADDFWCHQNSLLIHPIGWAQLIGHELKATEEYANESLHKAVKNTFDEKDAAWTLFPPVRKVTPVPGCDPPIFELGMKLEAIDPLNLSTICVATVVKVLRCDYLMIGIDGMMSEDGSDWFCYHASSPCIFPAGFCQENGIKLSPPINYVEEEFNWDEYLKATNSVAAPAALFRREIPDHGINEGDLLEAVDLMEPNLICVATVARVVGRLLRVHFNGWEDTYDQWIDCESPDLFPPGWCSMVGYNLEPPRNSADQYSVPNGDSRTRKKSRAFKMGHKRRRVYNAGSRLRDSYVASESSSHDYMDEDDSNSVLTPERPTVGQESSEQLTPQPQLTPPPLPCDPNKWNVMDVENFLNRNNYSNFAPAFVQKVGKEFQECRYLSCFSIRILAN